MPHYPKPFFRKARKLWYVQIRGKQVNLGSDRQAAFNRYHELMAEPTAELPPRRSASPYVAEICDDFLDWVSKKRSTATFGWYRSRLQGFVKAYPQMTVAELKIHHVETWGISKHTTVTTQRNMLRSVKCCLSWAVRQGHIEKSPIANMEVPSALSRQTYVTQKEFSELLAYSRNERFKDLLIVAYETGCRPQELLRVKVGYVDINLSRWVFPIEESKGKSMPRVVYFSGNAMAITRRLMTQNPEDLLFRNSKGRPWTKDSVGCMFDRLQVRMGTEKMIATNQDITDKEVEDYRSTLNPYRLSQGVQVEKKLSELRTEAKVKLRRRKSRRFAQRYSLYSLRHTWATNALKNGVDSLTVAILMGHKDPSQLARTYQHLSHNPEHMLSQAKEALKQSSLS